MAANFRITAYFLKLFVRFPFASDRLRGVPDDLQLHRPGEDAPDAHLARVPGHFVHLHDGVREGARDRLHRAGRRQPQAVRVELEHVEPLRRHRHPRLPGRTEPATPARHFRSRTRDLLHQQHLLVSAHLEHTRR